MKLQFKVGANISVSVHFSCTGMNLKMKIEQV